jgi:hypothetical protein
MSLVVTMASQLMTTLELLQQGSDDGTDVWMDGWLSWSVTAAVLAVSCVFGCGSSSSLLALEGWFTVPEGRVA